MDDGITITEIVERAMMQKSALSRALMSMVKEATRGASTTGKTRAAPRSTSRAGGERCSIP
jgi:hypothetical protein